MILKVKYDSNTFKQVCKKDTVVKWCERNWFCNSILKLISTLKTICIYFFFLKLFLVGKMLLTLLYLKSILNLSESDFQLREKAMIDFTHAKAKLLSWMFKLVWSGLSREYAMDFNFFCDFCWFSCIFTCLCGRLG